MTTLLDVRSLEKNFQSRNNTIRAVAGVSFTLEPGQTTAIVGESGCGKSTIANCLLGLTDADGGEILFDGADVRGYGDSELRQYRQNVGMVFQNPYSSLNPKMKIVDIVGEPLSTNLGMKGADLKDRVTELLSSVGLGHQHLKRFPHQFSGGQRQRIAIARALALKPRLLILDEPTAALDVSVQAQVLNLLKELQHDLGIAAMFISHNLATVEYIANNVIVMYLGKIVEKGDTESIFNQPRHPYTKALLESVPSMDVAQRGRLKALEGEIADPANLPPGCAFNPRCPQATNQCRNEFPSLSGHGTSHHFACFNPA